MKNTHGGVLLLLKPPTLLKVTLLHGGFLPLYGTNGVKLRKASHLHHFETDILSEHKMHVVSQKVLGIHVYQN